MLKRHNDALNFLFEFACQNDKLYNTRIAAGIMYKKEFIAVSTNLNKTHPIMKRINPNKDKIFQHAEVAATIQAGKILGIENLKDCSIFIARAVVDNGKFLKGFAKPCKGCQRLIDEVGYKNIFYTEDDENRINIKYKKEYNEKL